MAVPPRPPAEKPARRKRKPPKGTAGLDWPKRSLYLGWKGVPPRPAPGFHTATIAAEAGPQEFDPLLYEGDGHLMTIAPTGAGKGVSVIIPNLLTYPGSVIAIDI